MMAVQAQFAASSSFPHDTRAIRPALENAAAASASAFLDETAALLQQQLVAAVGGGGNNNTVFSDPRSELTCSQRRRNYSNFDDDCGGFFVPRKLARLGGDGDEEGVAAAAGLLSVMEAGGHRALLPPPVPVTQAFGDVQKGSSSRLVGSGAASTSGRPVCAGSAAVSHGLLSHLYRHSVEVDALVRFENERLRAGLEEARRRHLRAVMSAVERAAARRLHAAEAELERALGRNAELDEKLRQIGAEGQAWLGIAKSHEAAAAGLRATLDQLLQSPCSAGAAADAEGDAEDAQSCCFVQAADGGAPEVSGGGNNGRRRACRACGEADAYVLLLPCRHLCLCGDCEAAADACPVCAATKNASLHVLLP
ncbi:hypothetical protein E2562_011342 [Oryza meyeriana var. granulata]|uniref:RING-type domain-containing protein n=1 Tax=Oryza meyeriana var. granulata TaxID=110450 RepID=A0A6G1BWE4_9ORYZ|nr:hypothetical protein E2562_011342 [Oryza meyeriana var. granulata]